MAINVVCPGCGRQYSVKDETAGKRFKCKDCNTVVDVPAAASGDEFGADDYGDPYGRDVGTPMAPAPARRKSSGTRSAGATAAAAQTKLPAIFMYVFCALSLAYSIAQLVTTALGINETETTNKAILVGFYVAVPVFIVRDAFLIYSFSRMHVLKSFGIAYAGAVISVIPGLGSPCCVLGIPFGIWSLIVLNNPSVKAAFR